MKVIPEVAFMRPVLILILVFYHAFAISNGGWDCPMCYTSNAVYSWMANISYSFMLESFVFMSGYVYSFQCKALKKNYSFGLLVKKKFNRLIVPYLVFGLLYIVIFYNISDRKTIIWDFCWGGIGHLWFLPMLFWCFLFLWLVLHIKAIRHLKYLKFVLLLIIAVFSFIPLPFRMTSSLYFLFFFYVGFFCYENKNYVINFKWGGYKIILLWIFYTSMFVVLYNYREAVIDYYKHTDKLPIRIGLLAYSNIIRIVYSLIGTLLFWLTSMYYSISHDVSTTMTKIGGYCFGVYIFQQFILKWLYFHTNISMNVPSVLLPWLGFSIALNFSYVLSLFFSKSAVGKKLIG